MQIRSAKDLIVYQKAYALAMEIFQISKRFPRGEIFPHGSDPPFITVRLHKYSRSVGETQL